MISEHRRKCLEQMLSAHRRVALIGSPRTGAQTLATEVCMDRMVFYATTIAADWSDIPDRIVDALCTVESFLMVGGVHAARALRNGLRVDGVVYLDEPQEALSKQTNTIFRDWRRVHLTIPVVSPDRLHP